MARKPVALALAIIGLAVAAAPANAFDRGYLSPGIFSRGPVQGVALLARTSARRARVTVSLHGLDPAKTYVVGWYTKPCSKPEAAPTATASVAVETLAFLHLGFVTRPIAFTASPARIKSVRIWDKEHVLSCSATSAPVRLVGVLNGAVKGIVTVVAAGTRGNARGYASLHDLKPDTDYRVVGSTRPCSRPHTPAALAFASAPDLHTAAHEAAHFLGFSLNFEKYKTTDVKSVRVLTRAPGGRFAQAACSGFAVAAT